MAWHAAPSEQRNNVGFFVCLFVCLFVFLKAKAEDSIHSVPSMPQRKYAGMALANLDKVVIVPVMLQRRTKTSRP